MYGSQNLKAICDWMVTWRDCCFFIRRHFLSHRSAIVFYAELLINETSYVIDGFLTYDKQVFIAYYKKDIRT